MQSRIDRKDLSYVSHIGVVVRDVDETAEFLSSFGVAPWHAHEREVTKAQLIVGEPLRLKVSWSKLWGELVLELLQPLDETSILAKFLKTNGEKIHHLAFSVSNWDEIVSKIEDQGGSMMLGGIIEGRHWCYMETNPGGIIMELMEGDLHNIRFPSSKS